jgi:hypothetical protein
MAKNVRNGFKNASITNIFQIVQIGGMFNTAQSIARLHGVELELKFPGQNQTLLHVRIAPVEKNYGN